MSGLRVVRMIGCFALAVSLCGTICFAVASPAVAAAFWSWTPSPFACNSSSNSCVSDTGFNPSVSTWAQDTNSKGNCTNYVAFRLAMNGATKLAGTGDATSWKSRVQSQFGASAADNTPKAGSIAWWAGTKSSPSGHVGYVERVDGNTIYTSESIWNVGSRRRVITLGQSTWPTAFLHIKDAPQSSATAAGSSNGPAVSKAANQTDTFFVKTDGCLYDAWWGPGSKGVSPVACGVANVAPSSVSKAANQTDTFFVKTDGCLYNAWWNPGSSGVSQVACGAANISPAAVSKAANQTDTFFVKTDGCLYNAWWGPGSNGVSPVACGAKNI